MRYRTLDVVVLDRELPDRGLRKGDLGAVVEVYEPDGLEVEVGPRLRPWPANGESGASSDSGARR